MKIQCDQCDARYTIDEAKIPEHGASARCKKCGARIRIEKPPARERPGAACPKCRSAVEAGQTECPRCGIILAKYKEPAPLQNGPAASGDTFRMSPPADQKDEDTEPPATMSPSQMDRKQLLGLAGAAILFIGVFTPLVSVPIVGSVTYIQNGRGDGWIMVALAMITVILAIRRSYKWFLATGGGALAVMAITFIVFQVRFSEYQSQLETELAGNPFKGLAEAAMQAVQFQWGWAVLVIGAALIISAAILRTE